MNELPTYRYEMGFLHGEDAIFRVKVSSAPSDQEIDGAVQVDYATDTHEQIFRRALGQGLTNREAWEAAEAFREFRNQDTNNRRRALNNKGLGKARHDPTRPHSGSR